MLVRATAKNLRVSPRKVRRIAALVQGRRVAEALALLRYVPSPLARLVSKVVQSAAANAENNYQMLPAALKVVQIVVNEAPRLKRYRPRSRGRVSPLLKRGSHITVAVDEET